MVFSCVSSFRPSTPCRSRSRTLAKVEEELLSDGRQLDCVFLEIPHGLDSFRPWKAWLGEEGASTTPAQTSGRRCTARTACRTWSPRHMLEVGHTPIECERDVRVRSSSARTNSMISCSVHSGQRFRRCIPASSPFISSFLSSGIRLLRRENRECFSLKTYALSWRETAEA